MSTPSGRSDPARVTNQPVTGVDGSCPIETRKDHRRLHRQRLENVVENRSGGYLRTCAGATEDQPSASTAQNKCVLNTINSASRWPLGMKAVPLKA